MPKVSVCFPYRSDGARRDEIFEWILWRWRDAYPDFEIVRGDCDEEKFNRSAAINNAVEKSSGDTLIVADSDTIFHKEFVNKALTRSGWGFPFRSYFNMTKKCSDWVLTQRPNCNLRLESTEFFAWGNENVSGVMVISRQDLEHVGGFDEGFVGWGYEDLAFATAAEKLLGPPFRVEPGYVLHLWHESADEYETTTSNQRYFERRYR